MLESQPTLEQIQEWKEIIRNIGINGRWQALNHTYPEIYNHILYTTQYLSEDCKFAERIFCYVNNLTTQPKCPKCGRKTNFINGTKGYHKYCSPICARTFIKNIELTRANKMQIHQWKEIIKNIKPLRGRSTIIKHAYPNIYNYILIYTHFLPKCKFAERIFCFMNNLIEIPKCPICGKNVKFTQNGTYPTYCSKKCAQNSVEVRNKIKTNLFKKYNTLDMFTLFGNGSVSEISLKFINELLRYLPEKKYYYDKDEWFLNNQGKGYKYDFTDQEQKKIIEFYGDYFHGNPLKYPHNTEIDYKGKGIIPVENVWLSDKKKIDLAVSKGYKVLIIWENGYNQNPGKVIKECVDFLKT